MTKSRGKATVRGVAKQGSSSARSCSLADNSGISEGIPLAGSGEGRTPVTTLPHLLPTTCTATDDQRTQSVSSATTAEALTAAPLSLESLLSSNLLNELVERVAGKVIEKLQETIDFNLHIITELKGELVKRDETIADLRCQLEERTDDIEQYQRRNSLRIFGIPEAPSEDTDLQVLAVAAKVNVPLELSKIDRSHRVGPRVGNKSRPIIVKFVSYADRNALFKSKKYLRNTGITIREDLTRIRMGLLKQAIEHFGLHSVWTFDGNIVVLAGGSKQRVATARDLQVLKRRFPAPSK